MTPTRTTKSGSCAGLIAGAALVVLVGGGMSFVGVAMAAQRPAPAVPTEIDGSITAVAEVLGTSESWTETDTTDPRPPAEGSPELLPVTLPESMPVALDIPSIGVHSVLQHLGQTSEGALEAPAPGPHYNEAAWYRYSPTPGSLGPAVLLGHVDSAAEGPSVFFRLGELEPGDRVSITRADDSIAVFVVDEVHRYAKDDFPTQLVYGDIDHAGLRIVTCGGAFDDTTGHYLDNIVVFASLEGSPKK